jgi:hypothetical protein
VSSAESSIRFWARNGLGAMSDLSPLPGGIADVICSQRVFRVSVPVWHSTIDRRQRPMSDLCAYQHGQEEVVIPPIRLCFQSP